MAQPGSGHVRLGRAGPIDLGWGQECQAQFDGYQQSQGPRGMPAGRVREGGGWWDAREEVKMLREGRGALREPCQDRERKSRI